MKISFGRAGALAEAALGLLLASLAAPGVVRGQDEDKQRSPQLQGYDPTAYLLDGKAQKGDPAQQVEHNGKAFCFVDEEHKQKFQQEPEKYLPQFGGMCTCALGGSYGNRFPADPTVFDVYEGKVYLFLNERAKTAYDRDKAAYVRTASERWAKPALDGYCPVTSLKQRKAVKGSSDHFTFYKRWRYHFTSAEARDEFAQSPEKYLPQFLGFCAMGVHDGKLYPADPSFMRVVDDKLYLLYDEDAAKEFDKGPAEVVKTALEKWGSLKDEAELKVYPRAPKGGANRGRDGEPARSP